MLLAALLDELKHVLAPLFVFFFPRAKLKWPIFRCVALLLRTRSDYFQTDSDEEGPHHYIPRHRIIFTCYYDYDYLVARSRVH